MLQVIDVCNLNNEFKNTNSLFDGKEIYIETTKVDNKEYYYAINRFNYTNREWQTFEFNNLAELVTRISSNNSVYYVNIVRDKETYHINLNKIDCCNFKEENIVTIDTGIKTSNEEYYDKLSSASKLIAVNDRCVFLFIPHCEHKFGQAFYHKSLLIDSLERKVQIVPDFVAGMENLLSMNEYHIMAV